MHLPDEPMDSIFEVRVTTSEGTEAHNVRRTIAYAASQMGLDLGEVSLDGGLLAFRGIVSGDSAKVSKLLGLVELAFPQAEVELVPLGRQKI